MNKAVAALVLFVIASTFASADLIVSGYHPIPVNNTITNIADFPDYVFVSVGTLGAIYGGNCRVELVSANGDISSDYYKFCQVSVYAINKTNFNSTNLIREVSPLSVNETSLNNYNKFLEAYFSSNKATKVITNIIHYDEVEDSSTEKSVGYEYTIELGKTLSAPTNTIIEIDQNKKTYNTYIYLAVAVLALVIISAILFLRHRK